MNTIQRRMTLRRLTSTRESRPDRRQFLQVMGGLGLAALLDACGSRPATPIPKDAPLETTSIRIPQFGSVCLAPQYLAEDLLKAEGFTDVQYVKVENDLTMGQALNSGEVDISLFFIPRVLIYADRGEPGVIMLAGTHVGCFELFATNNISAISDLKGRTIPINAYGAAQHVFISSMVAYAGLDPNTDINWVVMPPAEAIPLLAEGKVDAYLAFAPTAQELRANQIGQVIVNSMMDDPWSQYFCCMVTVHQAFVEKNPVATKRALRTLLQASDLCAREPELAAQFMVDKGYTKNYAYALEAMQQIPYNRWRDYDPEDTVRFYALRLNDAEMIQSSPDEIIEHSTDWRFLEEIKAEAT